MILIALDFWNIVLLAVLFGVLLIAYRLMWSLAIYSERAIAFMAQAGMRAQAKTLLAILIGYTSHTYYKSRFVLWNQVHVRFALLWGIYLATGALLFLLHKAHVVGSVPLAWLLAMVVYIGYRCLTYWTSPAKPPIQTEDPDLKALIQDVNERSVPASRHGQQYIRRWDYLDELFAEPV